MKNKILIAILIVIIVLLSIILINLHSSFSDPYLDGGGCSYSRTSIKLSDITLSINNSETDLIGNLTNTTIFVSLIIQHQRNFSWNLHYGFTRNFTENNSLVAFSPYTMYYNYKFPQQISYFTLTIIFNSSNVLIRDSKIFNGSNELKGSAEMLKDGRSPIFHLINTPTGVNLTQGRDALISVDNNGWAFDLKLRSSAICP